MEKTIEVHVQKNELPLQPGQSVNNFTRELGDMVRGHLSKKLNLDRINKGDDSAHVWISDTFSDTVVAEVSTFQKSKTPSHERKFFAVGYNRDNVGVLKLGDPVEVVRRVTFVPKTPLLKSVTKCEVNKGFWHGVL